jgi:sugar O-acyltransferase (sialic acid O-acetyltransferase NeuD family)
MKSLAILGGGGHGMVVADCAEECGITRIDLFDDDISRKVTMDFHIVGTGADLLSRCRDYEGVIVAIGNNQARMERQKALKAAGATMAVLIHPSATVSRHTQVGAGTVVFAGAVVNVGACLGEAVIVNTGATVDHDCIIANGVHVAPGAHLAGGIRAGEETWIGVGAVVREYVTIGNRVCIGAGAVVVKSIANDATVVGNPARPLIR